MRICLAVLFSILVLPLNSYALPTPDILISIVNIVPLVTGAAVTAGGGILYAIRGYLGSDLRRLLPLGFVILVILLAIGGARWHFKHKEQRIASIGVYLRCDPAAHEAGEAWKRAKVDNSLDLWREFGDFQIVKMHDIAGQIQKQPDAALVDTTDPAIEFHSGMPTVKVGNRLLPFSHSRAMELPAHLATVNTRDLYLNGFGYIKRPPELYPLDKSIFRKFDHVYIVQSIHKRDRYVFTDDNTLQVINRHNRLIEWPVEREKWIYDEKPVAFPNMARLLTDKDAAKLLKQEDVYLLAPYDSSYRSKKVYERVYLKRMLYDVARERILPIDINSPETSRRLAEIAHTLDDKKFMIIAMSKQDWLYSGIDAAFSIWRQLDQDTGRFHFIGSTARLPEVAAVSWEAETSLGLIEALHDPFWHLVSWLGERLHMTPGWAIFAIALLLRMICFPIGYMEAASRLRRTRIQHLILNSERPAWSGSAKILQTHLHVSNLRELLGTAVMLILVLPAYKVLSDVPADLQQAGFLWVKELTHPDVLLSLLVGWLLFLKLRLGVVSSRKYLLPAAGLGFTIILCFLPSSLIIYLFAVLLVTMSQDILSSRRSEKLLGRALLTIR